MIFSLLMEPGDGDQGPAPAPQPLRAQVAPGLGLSPWSRFLPLPAPAGSLLLGDPSLPAFLLEPRSQEGGPVKRVCPSQLVYPPSAVVQQANSWGLSLRGRSRLICPFSRGRRQKGRRGRGSVAAAPASGSPFPAPGRAASLCLLPGPDAGARGCSRTRSCTLKGALFPHLWSELLQA